MFNFMLNMFDNSCHFNNLITLVIFNGTKAFITMLLHQRLSQSNIPLMGRHAFQNHMQIAFFFFFQQCIGEYHERQLGSPVAYNTLQFLDKTSANSLPPPLKRATLVMIAFN